MNKLLKKAKENTKLPRRTKIKITNDQIEVVVALVNGEVSNKAAAQALERPERTLNAYVYAYLRAGVQRGVVQVKWTGSKGARR